MIANVTKETRVTVHEIQGVAPAVWRKAKRSITNSEPQCVEVGRMPGLVMIRDSKSPDDSVLELNPADWRRFVTRAKRGRFDL